MRARRGNSMQKMLPLLDSILIPYHRGLRAMISLRFWVKLSSDCSFL